MGIEGISGSGGAGSVESFSFDATKAAREKFDELDKIKQEIDSAMTKEAKQKAIEKLEKLSTDIKMMRTQLNTLSSLDQSLGKVEQQIDDLKRTLGIPA